MGFSVMLYGAEFWFLLNTGALLVLTYSFQIFKQFEIA